MTDRALREAGLHLTHALRVLQETQHAALAADAFRLANRILQARQQVARVQPETEATTA
jgi:hypothetical protein